MYVRTDDWPHTKPLPLTSNLFGRSNQMNLLWVMLVKSYSTIAISHALSSSSVPIDFIYYIFSGRLRTRGVPECPGGEPVQPTVHLLYVQVSTSIVCQ